jgi:hypothetical protein
MREKLLFQSQIGKQQHRSARAHENRSRKLDATLTPRSLRRALAGTMPAGFDGVYCVRLTDFLRRQMRMHFAQSEKSGQNSAMGVINGKSENPGLKMPSVMI